MQDSSAQQKVYLAEAIGGDSDSFAKLFEQYRPRLRRMVDLRMDARARARFDASDVLQEAFVEAARALPKYAEKSDKMPFFLWLRLVTGDRLAKFHRRHLGTQKRDANRDARLVAEGPEASSIYLASQLAGEFTSVDHNLKQEEARQQLEAALASMDEKDREVIAMRHYEELSTEEIAIVLEMTKSGVLKRYARALRKLHGAMGLPEP
jgi:RNA polymerase sigma-70 factor (ECF subfamily)